MRAPLPPGPKPQFLVGNLKDLPKPGEREWEHWLKHKNLYSGISSVTVMGQTLVIINDVKLAYELMEKRSSFTSSRPKQYFAGEMLGWENSLAFSPYSSRFRVMRKKVAKILGSQVAASHFNSLQEVEVGHLLLHILDSPENIMEHIRREAGSVILRIAYGYNAETHKNDPLIDLAGEAMDQFGQAAVPGAWLVDVMPFLRYLPDWFPGTGFKRTAKEWGRIVFEVKERPYALVKQQMAQGKYQSSFLSALLEEGESNAEEASINKWSAASLYSAGADTTVSSMACFFLAMTLFPEVQRTAQQEIDQVIGSGRLPTFKDRANLPYIDAVVKELFRWHPAVPMSLPHMTTEDDICGGYLIPKGAYLLANIWWFAHDPTVYHDPMAFKPERFLATDNHTPEPDPHKLSFGFGRRICPGRILADNTVYLNVVQSLAVLKISKVVENGREVDPEVNFLPGVVSHPAPYKTSVKPRSLKHEALIRSIEKIHPWQESDAKKLETATIY